MMTDCEIQKIVEIMATADNGCPWCFAELVKRLCDAFPDRRLAILRHARKENTWDERKFETAGSVE